MVSSTVYQLNTHSYKETIINIALTEGTNHTANQCIKIIKASDTPSVKFQYHSSSNIHTQESSGPAPWWPQSQQHAEGNETVGSDSRMDIRWWNQYKKQP